MSNDLAYEPCTPVVYPREHSPVEDPLHVVVRPMRDGEGGNTPDTAARRALSRGPSGARVPHMRIYLAHPYAARDFGKGLQIYLSAAVPDIEIVNPFERPEQAEFEETIQKQGFLWDAQCKRIVNMDLAKIMSCDGLVAILSEHASVGTHLELAFAYEHHKHTIAYIPTGIITRDRPGAWNLYFHPWIREYSDDRVTTKESLAAALRCAHDMYYVGS